MEIQELITNYQHNEVVAKLTDYVGKPSQGPLHVHGIIGSLDALLITALYRQVNALQLIIADDPEEAWAIYGDISNLLPNCPVRHFPSLPHGDHLTQLTQQGSSSQDKRIAILEALNRQESIAVIVSDIAAFATKVMPPEDVKGLRYQVSVGQPLTREPLKKWLHEMDFERVDCVYKPMQYSIRGAIIDIYPTASSSPYRIEYWGDSVSSIRLFDPKDQKSFADTTTVAILSNRVSDSTDVANYTSFTTYLPTGSCIWIKNPEAAFKQLEAASSSEIGVETNLIASLSSFHQIFFGADPPHEANRSPDITYTATPQPSFQKNFKRLAKDLHLWNQQHYTAWITALNAGQTARIDSMLQAQEPRPTFTPLLLGLRAGFIDHKAKIACYTDHQIFNKYYRHQPRKAYSAVEPLLLNSISALQVGDYVVHSDYGVGRFAGLHTLPIQTYKQEVIRLMYKNNDLVYVTIHELYKISKYRSKEGTTPTMHTLGTTVWQRKKSIVKKQIKDIAKELITLYAARKQNQGFAFAPDSALDTIVASSFCYEETPDQAAAITAVKADMEQPIPMDRLVCGDVGFGKTEIALRAACKAAIQGKQVAILVPTTILALQHYNSFISRLSDLPVAIGYINRFKSKAEINKVLIDTAAGKIDILIGTHQLLSTRVQFKDLGLLIIDEEQKFGVRAKEKLKQMRLHVDTLTLTATPIPRTLHFSLMGARDLSLLTTPPPNRRPICTKVLLFDLTRIQEAVEKEVARGGQVFFVHNRISDLHAITEKLVELLPDIRICMAHGQMAEGAVETTLLQFIAGHYDVLISTNIIESGIDIANANTILINNSHLLGLADLHQMRGRVGRSDLQAFCYLLIPSNVQLTSESRLRLSALEEFCNLGDGFQLAMRDLDIRGAGDLLGASQSGFIADIGFETYCKILEEAVQEVKADCNHLIDNNRKEPLSHHTCAIEMDCEALLPPDYIANTAQRIALYKRLNDVHTTVALKSIQIEFIDRFGTLPPTVERLFDTVGLRLEGQRIGLDKIVFKNRQLHCYIAPGFQKKTPDMWKTIFEHIQNHAASCQLKSIENQLILTLKGPFYDVREASSAMANIGIDNQLKSLSETIPCWTQSESSNECLGSNISPQ